MNAPDPATAVFLNEDEKKVRVLDHTSHRARVRVAKEDDTLGNLWRARLLLQPNVTSAAYTIPHPLTPEVDIQCTLNGPTGPVDVMLKALDELLDELAKLRTQT